WLQSACPISQLFLASRAEFPVRLPTSIRTESLRASTLCFWHRFVTVVAALYPRIHQAGTLATAAKKLCGSKGTLKVGKWLSPLILLEEVRTTPSAKAP